MSVAATATRRHKWHHSPVPPPPSPKILNLPSRLRRKSPKTTTTKPTRTRTIYDRHYRGKLEALFDQERTFSRHVPIVLLSMSERRGRVEEKEEEEKEKSEAFMDERFRFQAEILRAECNFLRMEREFALKKLERNRLQMERTLKSAVQTLASGRKKIHEGKNVDPELEEEIEDLTNKLEELRKSSKTRGLRKCGHFDQQASVLQRRLEKLGGRVSPDENCVKEIRELAESSLSIDTNHELDNNSFASDLRTTDGRFDDVELLRRKIEGLSEDMLDRVEEEYGSMVSRTAISSVASPASTSNRNEFPDPCSLPTATGQLHQESVSLGEEEKKCSGRCKDVVRRIMEQVRAETEQWSQMQEMLGQVRQEMEELRASRDFWEDRAIDSDREIQSLSSDVQEWKQKALVFETNTAELQLQVSALKGELEKVKNEQKESTTAMESPPISLGKQLQKEMRVFVSRMKENRETNSIRSKQNVIGKMPRIEQKAEAKTGNGLPRIALGKQPENEKEIHRANNKLSIQDNLSSDPRLQRTHAGTSSTEFGSLKRSPLKDIGNSSPLMKQKSKAVFPLQGPKPLKIGKSF